MAITLDDRKPPVMVTGNNNLVNVTGAFVASVFNQNGELLDIAKELHSISIETADPVLQSRLKGQIRRLLDVVEGSAHAVSAAVVR